MAKENKHDDAPNAMRRPHWRWNAATALGAVWFDVARHRPLPRFRIGPLAPANDTGWGCR